MSSRCVLFCMLLVALSIPCVLGINEGVFDKIKAGLQNAKNYLETAREIADLVSKSLKPKQAQKKRGDDADFNKEQKKKSFEPTNLVSSFFRLLGLDSKKVTAVAVNSFLFFSQMISEFFKITPTIERGKAFNDGDYLSGPMRVITESENEKVQNLYKQAQDENLPDRLLQLVNGYDSTCVRLLLCKTSPIIWAAQRSLKSNSNKSHRDITSWLPSREEFEDYSDMCDDKHKDCPIPYEPS